MGNPARLFFREGRTHRLTPETNKKMGGILSSPVACSVVQRKGNETFKVGASWMQGYREFMEGSETIELSLPNHPNTGFFAVFDGHSGEVTAQHLGQRLKDIVDALDDFSDENLINACLEMDVELKKVSRGCGSTGVFALIEDIPDEKDAFNIITANVGDSRCVHTVGGSSDDIVETKDHKPGLPEERERIENAGGFINNDRVDGGLALSRAFGDFSYKGAMHLGATEQKVIAVPDVVRTRVVRGDICLICCDGIWDVMSSKEGIEFSREHMLDTDGDLGLVCQRMIDTCLLKGSKDNMTAMLVQIVDGSEWADVPMSFTVGPYEEERSDNVKRKYREFANHNGFDLLDELEKTKAAAGGDGGADGADDGGAAAGEAKTDEA